MKTAEELRQAGIDRAARNAAANSPDWMDKAVDFVTRYAMDHEFFAGEDAREASKGIVAEPPHLRAWGGVMTRCAREGVVEKTDRVRAARNPNVHCGNVNIWRSRVVRAKAA